MKIISVTLINYRNFAGQRIVLSPDCSILVGENNMGKSNVLDALNSLFNRVSFCEEDFRNPLAPIEIVFTLCLSPIEIGHFQDVFDAESHDLVTFSAVQTTPDDQIEFKHVASGTQMSFNDFRGVNFVHYESLRSPQNELSFQKGRGVGRFLGLMVQKEHQKLQGVSRKKYIHSTAVKTFVGAINRHIHRLKAFSDFGMCVGAEEDDISLLQRILQIKDRTGGRLEIAGFGVQFLVLITLSVLDSIERILKRRRGQGVFDAEGGTRLMSLVLGLDEPENHLHPCLQRSLISYLKSILNNENVEFLAVVKELFGIDGFSGQLIVATHSPAMIGDDYQKIVRLYRKNGTLTVVSGAETTVPENLKKHYLMQLPFFQDAFFSRCNIIVEGDSEFGSFPLFARKVNVDFDALGISVIQARGSGVELLMSLSRLFGIPAVGIVDRDRRSSATTANDLFVTTRKDFEEEIVGGIISRDQATLVRIVEQIDREGFNAKLQAGALNKEGVGKYRAIKRKVSDTIDMPSVLLKGKPMRKAFFLTWFVKEKSLRLGRLIGGELSKDQIPRVYRQAIFRAKELAIG